MIPQIIKQWEDNKHLLQEYFATTKQDEYSESYLFILKKIFEIVITKTVSGYEDGYNWNEISMVDNGECQGTQIFLIPDKTYEPEIDNYLVTNTYYGSCSGCDTLLSIGSYDTDLPTPKQVTQYMTLSLHLVQKLRELKNLWVG